MRIAFVGRVAAWMVLFAATSLPALPLAYAGEAGQRDEPVAAPRPAALADRTPGRPSYRLEYRFETDQDIRFQVRSRSRVIVTKGDHTQRAENQTFTEKHFRVVSVDQKQVATLETYIDRVKMTYRVGNDDEQTFDTADEVAGDPRFARVLETVKVPLARMQVNLSGKLLHVTPLTPDADEAGQTQGEHQNIVIVVPDKPVSVGDEWSDRLQVKVNVSRTLKKPVELLRKYRLDSVQGDLAHISMRMAVITHVTDPMARAQLIQRTPSGEIVFDMSRGIIVSRRLSCDNTEVGIHGADSSIRATSESSERIVLPPVAARRPAEIAAARDPAVR